MDDWTALRAAVAGLTSLVPGDGISVIQDYVPRLISQYEELWELSQELLGAVEQLKSQGEGGILLVADSQEIRRFGSSVT